MKQIILKDPAPRLPRVSARATMSMSAPATEFVLFNELPAEMRGKIWDLIMPGPRFVLFSQLLSLGLGRHLGLWRFFTLRDTLHIFSLSGEQKAQACIE
jgi:hypothetical protein